MNKTKDLTEGRLFPQIIVFGLPLIVSNLLQVMFNITDVAVVGRFAGAIALGAVGSTTMIGSLFFGMLMGFGGGLNVVIAFHYGTKNQKNITDSIHTSFLISIIIGLSFFVIGQLSIRPLLLVLQTKEELFAGAAKYLRIFFLGIPAIAIYNCGNAIFNAAGDTRKPLFFLSISGVINVLLNLFFVIVLKIDVAGVAIASVISQYISAALILIALFTTKQPYKLSVSQMRIAPEKAKSVLTLGLPNAAQNGIFHIANLFFQYGVNSFDAVLVMGNAAAGNADVLTFSVMSAFYTACGSFIGQNFGAAKRKRIKYSYIYCLILSAVSGTVIFGTICLFGKSFLSIFTSDPDIIKAGMYRLIFLGLPYGFTALLDNTTSASRALGHGIVPTVIIIFGSCIFRIIWIYTIFARIKTIESLYMLYPVSWAITAIAEVVYFIYVYKKETKLIPNE